MKKYDFVSLKNLKMEYKRKKLYENASGIVLENLPAGKVLVLFLNDKIHGDYAVLEIPISDLKKENFETPQKMIEIIEKSEKLKDEKVLKKNSFEKLKFNEYDWVELIVEKEEYAKEGIHKGETGVVAIDYAIDNDILVDFSGIDENGEYYGECISVKIEDLRLIEKARN